MLHFSPLQDYIQCIKWTLTEWDAIQIFFLSSSFYVWFQTLFSTHHQNAALNTKSPISS